MKASGSERVVLWVAAVVLLAAGGCTNSEVIGTSTGGVSVTVEAQGAAGRYDLGILAISQIRLQFEDDQQGPIGEPVGLLARPIEIDLNNPEVISVQVGAPPGSAAALSEGTYRVVDTTVSQFTLVDEPPPMYGPECVEMVDILAEAGNVTQPSETKVEFQTPALLEISATAATGLRLIIDVPSMIGVFENQFICFSNMACKTNTFPPPCLERYITPTSTMLEPYLVFQQQQ